MSVPKAPPPQEDAREWLLFDIDDQDPSNDFLKPSSETTTPTRSAQVNHTFPEYRDSEDDVDQQDRPLISTGGLLTDREAPYVAEAERLERFESGEGRRYDIIKLPHIGGGIINSVINMSNSIIGAGMVFFLFGSWKGLLGCLMLLIARDLWGGCFFCLL
jgi:hypothetical protein